jgi:hypothetical protein
MLPFHVTCKETTASQIGASAMNRMKFVMMLVLCVSASRGRAQTQLPTLEEAIKISRATGKPIFAMAGQKT